MWLLYDTILTMRVIRGSLLIVLGCLILSSSCSEKTRSLNAMLFTDMVPGEEFFFVRAVLERDGVELDRRDRAVSPDEDYTEGEPIYALSDLKAGNYRLRIRVLGFRSEVIASRTVLVRLQDQEGPVRVIIPREATRCDEDACPEGQTCVGPICANIDCGPEHPELCPTDVLCRENDECPARADCAVPVCANSLCLYAQGTDCGPNEWCHPDQGCIPRTTSIVDAGTVDGSIFDGGVASDGSAASDGAFHDSRLNTDVGVIDAGVDGAGGCPTGFGDCDEDPDDCETPLDTTSNCGGCRIRCGPGPQAEAACIDSECGLICDTGYRNCDDDLVNGCETDITRDPLHCGGCGDFCPLTLPICRAGDCYENPFSK